MDDQWETVEIYPEQNIIKRDNIAIIPNSTFKAHGIVYLKVYSGKDITIDKIIEDERKIAEKFIKEVKGDEEK